MAAEYPRFLNGTEGFKEEVVKRRRIVVTGIGMVTPLGLTVDETWENLIAGKLGLSVKKSPYVGKKDTGYEGEFVAGLIQNFNPNSALEGIAHPKDFKKMSRAVILSLTATSEALKNAKALKDSSNLIDFIDPDRIGTIIGTGIGGSLGLIGISETVKEKALEGKKEEVSSLPSDTLKMEPERVASVPSMAFGLKGMVAAPAAACASGNAAIYLGIKEILSGDADMMVVGGSESIVNIDFDYVPQVAFGALGALSKQKEPEKAGRPFDEESDGFIMGEAAGVLILEEYEHAKKRGAPVLAEIVGWGATSDAYHDTFPDPTGKGFKKAIRLGFKRLNPGSLGSVYVNAHATGTLADGVETSAVREVIPLENLAGVSSTKSTTGHTVGAAGAIEAIFTLKAVKEKTMPPTIRVKKPIPQAVGLNLVLDEAQYVKNLKTGVNNSFGFGGINYTVVFQAA